MKGVIPKTLGACADMLLKLAEQKSKAQQVVDAIDQHEKLIKEHLIQNLPKEDSDGVVGKLAKAVIKKKPVPQVKDWPAFYKHVLKTKDFSLMQRRVSEAAVRELWESGKTVPGVDKFTVVTVSVTKV